MEVVLVLIKRIEYLRYGNSCAGFHSGYMDERNHILRNTIDKDEEDQAKP